MKHSFSESCWTRSPDLPVCPLWNLTQTKRENILKYACPFNLTPHNSTVQTICFQILLPTNCYTAESVQCEVHWTMRNEQNENVGDTRRWQEVSRNNRCKTTRWDMRCEKTRKKTRGEKIRKYEIRLNRGEGTKWEKRLKKMGWWGDELR